MEKKIYKKPSMELLEIMQEDVIATSPGDTTPDSWNPGIELPPDFFN